MATYTQIYNFRKEATATSQGIKARVTVAVATAAMAVLVESGATANHANRLVWAKASLKDAESEAERMFWGVVGDATFQAGPGSITDAQLQSIINGLVDTFAGG